MTENDYFSHNSLNETWYQRMQHFELTGTYIGENIAAGGGVNATISAWMNSYGHRRNILSTNFRSTGIGYAVSESGRPYWVQCFSGYAGDQ